MTDSTMKLFIQKVQEYKIYLQKQQSAQEPQSGEVRRQGEFTETKTSEGDRHA